MNTSAAEAFFWMNGRLATGVEEISHDPSSLDNDGFWAVQVDYEGRWTLVKFSEVREQSFPEASWKPVKNDWTSSHTKEEYIDYVAFLKEAIARGDVYQVNACRVLSASHDASLAGLFNHILAKNPAPYASFFSVNGREIASASPELFLSLRSTPAGIRVVSSPIKGTAKTPKFGEKDQSENVMIVDLIRNDLSRICVDGTVDVSRLLGIEEHPGLFHLVSDVTGVLKPTFSWRDFTEAVLPAGSISGAPKSSALTLISNKEKERGPYCGILGWIEKRGPSIDGVLSVAIRTFWREGKEMHFGTGAGITWGSDPAQEWEETELKARRLMAIANGGL